MFFQEAGRRGAGVSGPQAFRTPKRITDRISLTVGGRQRPPFLEVAPHCTPDRSGTGVMVDEVIDLGEAMMLRVDEESGEAGIGLGRFSLDGVIPEEDE